MKVSLKDAVAKEYARADLQLVINEALSNSLDAKATVIDLVISGTQQDYSETGTGRHKKRVSGLSVLITDNGKGFTSESVERFCTLYKTHKHHKGMGRLSFLRLFDKAHYNSVNIKEETRRSFDFTYDFNQNQIVTTAAKGAPEGTVLTLSEPKGQFMLSDVEIAKLKEAVIQEFFCTLYLKREDKNFPRISITIEIRIEGETKPIVKHEMITPGDLPAFNTAELTYDTQTANVAYAFSSTADGKKNFVGVNVDNRTICLQDLSRHDFGSQRITYLVLNLQGVEASADRAELDIGENELRDIKKAIVTAIDDIASHKLTDEYPKHAAMMIGSIVNSKPFLSPYIAREKIGFCSSDQLKKDAFESMNRNVQEFFDHTGSITDEEFEQRFQTASAILAQYVISRDSILKSLKELKQDNHEAAVHDLLLPRRSRLSTPDDPTSLYRNNLWVLNEQFMSYLFAFSDVEFARFIEKVNSFVQQPFEKFPAALTDPDHPDPGKTRPDIAIVFNTDPRNTEKGVSAVIIELKKRGSDLNDVAILRSQLQGRAQAMHDCCPAIDRVWYFGIADISPQIARSLKGDAYVPIFSSDQCYYRQYKILNESDDPCGFADCYIMSYEAVINDADVRLGTFRKLLRHAYSEPEKFNSDL